MQRIHSNALCLVLLALAVAANAAAGEGDTLITDPAQLTRLGFPTDARNVYLAKGAVLDQRSSPTEPEEFGTTDFGWATILGNQHRPVDSDTLYGFGPNFDSSIYYAGGPNQFDAQLHMPSGALLRQVAWFGYDATAGTLSGQVSRICQVGIPVGPPVITVLGSGDSTSANGSFVFVVTIPPDEDVRNLTCAYVAKAIFVGGGIGIEEPILRKVRVGWQRRVSPAPLSATFPNDTPTTHPYFQFIEALAAAGITGGCGPGSYCPDSPITRGEMAVFLSVALGLHFPN